ncbi:MAG: ribonuclease J [Armatimonadota bacterium]
MAKKKAPVSLIPLGGTAAIGKNMILVEQAGSILVVDAGLMFPDETLLGVDIVIPDMSYLAQRADDVVGIILTHGHEDHTGALPFLLDQVRAPVWGTPLTLGLVELKLREHGLSDAVPMHAVDAGESVEIGPFGIDLVAVNHSVPHGVGLGIHTAQGLIVHSGDFKFDLTPLTGPAADVQKLGALGSEGVLALIPDCTNIDTPGYTPSERPVEEVLDRYFGEATGRVIVATFASNLSRIQQAFNVAHRHGRKVALLGRSMVQNCETAAELGYLTIPEETLVDPRDLAELSPQRVACITTGTQGEPLSALSLMAQGEHKYLDVTEGDTVIISASSIPGNEALIFRTINNLFRRGAHVIHGPEMGVHVSGHGSREDIKMLLGLLRPKFLIPYHGEYRHLVAFRAMAAEMGVAEEAVFLLDLGDVLEFSAGRARVVDRVPAGSLNVDGLGVGDVGDVVLRDRQRLSQNGVLAAIIVLDYETREMLAEPNIYSRGFVYVRDAQHIMEEAQATVAGAIEEAVASGEVDREELEARVRTALRRRVYELTERRPIILPIVIEVGAPAEARTAPWETEA